MNWKTLHQLIYNEAPDISHLYVFECLAWVWINPEARTNKLSPKAVPMIYIGIPKEVKSFLFMRVSNNSVYMGTKVMFDETAFPRSAGFKLLKYTSFSKQRSNLNNDKPSEFFEKELSDPKWKRSSSCPHHERDQSLAFDRMEPADNPPEWHAKIPEERPQGEPRRSGRQVKPPTRPGNVYGESKAPTQILREVSKEKSWSQAIGEVPLQTSQPGQATKGNPSPSSAM